MSAQSWLNRVWYSRAKPPAWMLPLEALFGAAASFNRFLYAAKLRASTRLPRPVVVVGNLSVGGTGKTPLVCWLIAELVARGYRPGVVSRGYGGSNRTPRRVSRDDEAALVGDEPLLLARRTNVPVVVARDRPAGAKLLIEAGCDVIVSDDGLQHYALARDVEIVVVDAERGFGNGHLLPAGPLREDLGRLAAVSAIVANGTASGPIPGPFAGKSVLSMHLKAAPVVSLTGLPARALKDFSGRAVHAVAAIGNPERFFNALRAAGLSVDGRALPDHAALQPADIEFADDLPVLMTEKDAVKCAAFAGPKHWSVPVDADFAVGEGVELLGIVMRLIGAPRGAAEGNHG